MKAESLEGHYAGFLSRAFALVIDFWVVSGILTIISFLINTLLGVVGLNIDACRAVASLTGVARIACLSTVLAALIAILLTTPLYYTLCWTLVGQTVGQRLLGLRVIKLDGRHLGLRRSFLRFIGYALCFVTLGIGFLWVLVDDRRMGWHDKLARTCVVYSWKAQQNEAFLARVQRRFNRKRRERPRPEIPS